MTLDIFPQLIGQSITVYCSSSASIAPLYFKAAQELGALIARHGAILVYGGTQVGLMGAISQAVRELNGKTIGVIPSSLRQLGLADEEVSELVVTDGMRERKAQMEHRADAFIALPGGVGTLEEFFEIVTAKQLGFHRKPIVLLNINNYYKALLEQLEQAVSQEFMKPNGLELFYVARSVLEALEYIAHYQPGNFQPKWSNPTATLDGKTGEVPGTE